MRTLGYDPDAVVRRGARHEPQLTRRRRVVGTGAGGAAVAAELAAGGLERRRARGGRAPRPPHVHRAPARHDAAPVPRRRPARDDRHAADRPAARARGRRHDARQLRHLLPHAARVLERWARDDGIARAARRALRPRRGGRSACAEVPEALAGRNALLVKRGAEALGLSGGFLRRNAPGCRGSGVCAFGCPTGAKQHAGRAGCRAPRRPARGVLTGVQGAPRARARTAAPPACRRAG